MRGPTTAIPMHSLASPRPMRAPLLVFLLAATVLAGCLDDTGDSSTEALDKPATSDPVTASVTRARGFEENATDLVQVDPAFIPTAVSRYLPTSTFEPTIGSDLEGCLYMTSFRGAGTGTRIYKSCDQAATWSDVGPNLPGDVAPCFPNSNDPYVHVDRDTGRVFSSDLHALVTSTLHFTDDKGASWTCNVLGGGLPPGVHDHQTIATGTPRTVTTVGYPNVVYYCVNRVGDSVCSSSLTGGIGFGPFVTVYPGVSGRTDNVDPNDPLENLCGGLHGHVETDHAGRVYLPKGQCNVVEVAVSEDDGLTWTRSIVSARTGIQGHEVRVAADEADNMYAFWIGADGLPYLSVSTDHGATWGRELMVGGDELTYAGRPAVYAGGEGRVAFAYIGTMHPDGVDAPASELTIHAFMGAVYDALDEAPVVITTTANDPSDPIDRTRPCWSDRCGGIGDFIDITIDPEGRPWAAFADMCDENCVNGDIGPGSPVAFVGTFAMGASLHTSLPLAPLADLSVEIVEP